jgi:hypothetical protein
VTQTALAKHVVDLIAAGGRDAEVDAFVRVLRERLASFHDADGLEALNAVVAGTPDQVARNHIVRTLIRLRAEDAATAGAMRALEPPPDIEADRTARATVGLRAAVRLRAVELLTSDQLDYLERRSITTIPDLIAVLDTSHEQTARALQMTMDEATELRSTLWGRLPDHYRQILENVDRRPLVTGLLVHDK